MENKNNELQTLVDKLEQYRKKGKKKITLELNPVEAKYLSKYYVLEPYLYKIYTKRFTNIRSINNSLIREIHQKCKDGKKSFITSLKHKDKKTLNEYNIKYRPQKYNIYLNLSN